jgi:hypothetical protein
MTPRWARWTDHRFGCQFSDERAAENAAYLKSLLGQWIESGPAVGGGHLLQSHWTSGGTNAFLHLNALAEDLRLLQHVPGFASTLHDLVQTCGYEPTRHVLRSAALFERGGTRVVRLFEPSNESVPDFEVELRQGIAPVEAKQLTESEPSRAFRVYSEQAERRVLKEVLTGKRNYPALHVIIKDSDVLPSIDTIVSAVREALQSFVGYRFIKRFPELNVQVTPDPGAGGFSEYRNLHFLAPSSSRESPRIARRAEKSNKQLRNHSKDQVPGFLCLGLTEHQDARLVAEVLRKKFAGGQLRGISKVLLQVSLDDTRPPYGQVVDLISTVLNLKALVATPQPLPLKGIGAAADLINSTGQMGMVSAYKRARVEGRISAAGGSLGLSIPPGLTPSMLE